MATRSTRARTGAISAIVAVAALLTPIPAMIGVAVYAHSRPASEWTCGTTRELLIASGEFARITTCTVYGVTVSRTLNAEG